MPVYRPGESVPVYRPAEYILQDVDYVNTDGRGLPGILLYEVNGLSYVEFPTAAFGHYDGFGYYCTCAIHTEHMVPRDGKPLGTFYADEVDYKAGKSPALGDQHLECQLH